MRESYPGFDRSDVKIESEEVLFQGFFRMRRLHLRHRRFEGGWTQTVSREIFHRENATCVLPYDPVADCVVLIEQFRAGALGREASPWLLEVVAGINEAGDSAEATAAREAQEEADLELKALEHICDYLVSPGGTNEMVHLYGAWVDASRAGGVHGLADENEDIRVHILSFEDAMNAIRDGRIWNAPGIMSLQWLALNRERLREQWREGQ